MVQIAYAGIAEQRKWGRAEVYSLTFEITPDFIFKLFSAWIFHHPSQLIYEKIAYVVSLSFTGVILIVAQPQTGPAIYSSGSAC